LHLGIAPDAIPQEVRDIGAAFISVLADRNPFKYITYSNYLKVRKLRPFLKKCIDSNVNIIAAKEKTGDIKTFVHYWTQNDIDGIFKREDIVF
jgi:hypothetical protein